MSNNLKKYRVIKRNQDIIYVLLYLDTMDVLSKYINIIAVTIRNVSVIVLQ